MMHTIPLWPGRAPHAKGDAAGDNPTLDIYEPFGTRFPDAAILILPGGGYGMLSSQEGEGFAGVFQLHGFKAFVLNYRLGSDGYRHPVMLADAARALRIVRSRAAADGFDPNKIAIIGSSAGGHLAATLLTKWDDGIPDDPDLIERMSSRPDFGILCYPVITMGAGAHPGSHDKLLGENATADAVAAWSLENHVAADAVPSFICLAADDDIVPPFPNGITFFGKLREAKIASELHVFEVGGHGFSLHWAQGKPCGAWPGLFTAWAATHGFKA